MTDESLISKAAKALFEDRSPDLDMVLVHKHSIAAQLADQFADKPYIYHHSAVVIDGVTGESKTVGPKGNPSAEGGKR